MNISAEEKNRYLREAEVVLAREGFLTDRTNADRLRVLLDGLPLCEVPESGGVRSWRISRGRWPTSLRMRASPALRPRSGQTLCG